MLDSHIQSERGIIRGYGSARAQSRLHEAGRACTSTARATRGAARTSTRCACTVASDSPAWRSLHHSGVDAPKASSARCSQKIGIGDRQVVAGDGQIQVVLKRQINRIFQREVQLAITNKLV